jgi:DNA replication and repair protein RecF
MMYVSFVLRFDRFSFMKFKRVSVSNYRNIQLARLDVDVPRVFFHGKNGQGKTNMLEALGLATALRPFRTHENRKVIGPNGELSEIVYEIDHENLGETKLRARIKKTGKEVWIDDEAIRRLSDFVGRFPTVMLSSNDMQLARGSPGNRRRYLDAFICGVDRSYFTALQAFQKLLQERNVLLKKNAEPQLLAAFETQMDAPALAICKMRESILGELVSIAKSYHTELSISKESLRIEYNQNANVREAGDYLAVLEKNRKRDSYLQSTGKGPHRDDYAIFLNDLAAEDYASEGQQRSVSLSLALAMIEYWRRKFGFLPVALADDALGELDTDRKERFWSVLDEDLQIIATGTQLPQSIDGGSWKTIEVDSGTFVEP